jgi:hypothetical protein
MSRLVDRRPVVAPPVQLVAPFNAIAGPGLAIGVLLAPRRLLGWVAAAGARRVPETAFQCELVHPPG